MEVTINIQPSVVLNFFFFPEYIHIFIEGGYTINNERNDEIWLANWITKYIICIEV